ncbi:Mu transposase C-terminal domain-containing protein [Nonomuraea aurantiaca]|uniref:Mu transposase C-terminal domain-containing protein n=1 Tax=Nonomuraea aurantiaca TaxID=2878562 RepID=UPI001CD9B1E3|nr:Mu transposase C-terminal domain-containing protein [Nonomuraea aurantiaca]MCA2230207.1 Mu transposase C-terminal domain-containing protein [Nonomuraea aurantiaca]
MSAEPPDAGPTAPPGDTPAGGIDATPVALARYRVLVPHLYDGVTLKAAAASGGVPYRTAQRWLAAYKQDGLQGLARADRSDKGRRRLPSELIAFIEGLALKPPRPTIAKIHRQAVSVAAQRGWPRPGYGSVHEIVTGIDPALQVMAHEGTKRYREVYELVHRREASKPNDIWQADHTELDIWVIDSSGKPARPWLTAIEDDHSRAVAGYAVNLEAPSALTTALAFRHAIWRKSEPDWHVCGIPDVFHLDHGSDFTSLHLEQVMADLRVRPVFTKKGQPHGHGKIERLIGTVNQMCLAHLPGYAPRGTPDRASQAQLTLTQLDAAIGRFIREVYNQRPHSETKTPPQQRWEASAFIPRMPTSLEQLDLLLSTVAKPRKIHTDGIHFLNLRYIDPVLADYVTKQATIRYDPRDITEIRVYLRTLDGETFLCRAICPELSGETISLKEITAARNARRKQLRGTLTSRSAVVDRLLAAHNEPLPAAYPTAARAELSNWATPDETTSSGPGSDHAHDRPKLIQAGLPDPEQAAPIATRDDAPRLKRYWNE